MILSQDETAPVVFSNRAQLPDLLMLQTQVQDSDCLQFEKQEISAKTLGKKHSNTGERSEGQRKEIKSLTAKCHLLYKSLLIG